MPECRRAAVETAPGVLLAALLNHRDAVLTVEGAKVPAHEYIETLDKATDGGMLWTLADLERGEAWYRYAVVDGGECRLLSAIDENVMDIGCLLVLA